MSRTIRRLPDAELEVMQAIWACEAPVGREAVEERLRPIHPMAPTTLLTLLARLRDKGFVQVEKQGRRHVYTPCVTREAYLASQSRRFLERLCGGSLSAFANALCDSGLTREELARLRELLERDGR